MKKRETYLVRSNYGVGKAIAEEFEKRNIKDEKFTAFSKKYIRYIYTDGFHATNKIYYYVQNYIRNVSTPHRLNLGNKSYIYKNMDKKFVNEFMMKQYEINQNFVHRCKYIFDVKSNTNTLWILKPVSGYAGVGIKIVKSYKETKEHLNNVKLISNNEYRKKHAHYWVLAKYIDKPLLYEGSKFHIRAYMVIENRNSIINSYLFKYGYMIIANNKYSDDIKDMDRHNIHLDNSYGKMFPECYKEKYGEENTKKITQDMVVIARNLTKISDVRPYKESKCSFTVYGLDIMVDDNYNTILIECNVRPGFKYVSKNETLKKLYASFIVGIMTGENVDRLSYKIQ